MINQPTIHAASYARGISTNVTAVHLATEEDEDFSEMELFPDVPLVILESPYRSVEVPFLAWIDQLKIPPTVPLTIVVPEFVPATGGRASSTTRRRSGSGPRCARGRTRSS